MKLTHENRIVTAGPGDRIARSKVHDTGGEVLGSGAQVPVGGRDRAEGQRDSGEGEA